MPFVCPFYALPIPIIPTLNNLFWGEEEKGCLAFYLKEEELWGRKKDVLLRMGEGVIFLKDK